MTPDNEHWKLFDGTTAPPWEVCTNKAGNCTIRQVGSSGYLSPWIASERDAALIVAAVNALPELLAIKAERDRAQRACEQMGARVTEMENSLREIGAAIINGATDTLWMGDQISDETVVDFICNLTGDDPSLLGTFARAALNQEPKP